MRTLLWKDYRQNRRVLDGVAIVLAVPYVLFLALALCDTAGHADRARELVAALMAAATVGLVLSVGLCGFIGANAMAGERADRSAEFAAYLPIPRGSSLASKAILATGACAFMVLGNFAIMFAAQYKVFEGRDYNAWEPLLIAGVIAILIYGVAWLLSAILSSPVIAAAMSLASVIILGASIHLVHWLGREEAHILFDQTWLVAFLWSCAVLGIACFAAGTIYYLRRVEP